MDLGTDVLVQREMIYNRGDCCKERLSNSVVSLLDTHETVIGRRDIEDASNSFRIEIAFIGVRKIRV